jgi:O-6-methylguanine DNA methyltransferase
MKKERFSDYPEVFWAVVSSDPDDLLLWGTPEALWGAEFAASSALRQMKKIQKERFPNLEMEENPRPILEFVHHAMSFISGKRTTPPPLRFRGTPFQKAVWRELLRTQRGETLSYASLAERIGKPKAVRAVASAVAKNEFALIVPCHRVIFSTGDLGEYRWGAKRKKAILASEAGSSSRIFP